MRGVNFGRRSSQLQGQNCTPIHTLAAIGRETPAVTGSVTDTSDDARRKAEDQIAAYADIIAGAREFIAVQGQEAQALGMSADAAAAFRYEMDMLNAAQRDGIELTAEQRNEIAQYAQGMAQAERATQKLAQSQQDAAEISRFFGEQAIDALMGIADGSMTAKDALRQFLAALTRAALQAAFLGEGPLAGSLKGTGGLFGGLGRAIASRTSPAPVAAPVVQSIAQTPMSAVSPSVPAKQVAEATGKAVVEGLRGTLSDTVKTAFAPVADAVQPSGNALAALQYVNQGATRNMKLTPSLEAKIKEAVGAVYGPDAVAKIYSGGQAAKGTSTRRTGSTRHDGGMAADAYIFDAKGRQMMGDDLGPLAQYWQAKKFGGTGLEMRGGGIHLDEHTDRAPFWNYADKGGRITPGQLEAVRAGQRGVMPNTAGVDPTTTAGIDEAKAKLTELGAAGQQAATQIDQAKTSTQQAGQGQLTTAQQEMAAKQQLAVAQQQHAASTQQASTQVQLAGTSAQAAAPQFTQAGTAIQQAGQQAAAGAAQAQSAGMGGMGGIGGSLLSMGLGLLMPLLFDNLFKGGKKKTKTSTKNLRLAGGGQIRGPGTSTSDSIPVMASDGEFIVNARSAKKFLPLLEAINSGKAPAFASGGIVGGGMSNTYAPSLNINVASSGNPRQDKRLAYAIADEVNTVLQANQPRDTFRRSESQMFGQAAQQLQRAGSRQG